MGGFFDSKAGTPGGGQSVGGKSVGERSDGGKHVGERSDGEKPDSDKFDDEKPDSDKLKHKFALSSLQSIHKAPHEASKYPGLFILERDEYAQAQDIPLRVTKSDIVDRSKKDAFGKLVATLQTTWFIVQYSERWASHQARTQLEVMTLSYAAVNIFIYILWKEKPSRVQEPIDVRGSPTHADARQEKLRKAWWTVISEAWESLVDGVKTDPGQIVLPVIGALFGGVHCFAWRFPFPTESEATLWRVCAIYCTVFPVVFPTLLLSRVKRLDNHIKPLMYIKYVSITGYIACRFILLALTFTSLRATPPGIYAATDWTFFLPHVA